MRHWLFIFSENSQVMADLHIHASTLSVRTQISISLKVSQETTVSSRHELMTTSILFCVLRSINEDVFIFSLYSLITFLSMFR